MNTKTSILTALVALASGAGAMAQVYSQNVVGYVNVNLVPGFNFLANPLVNGANNVGQVVPTAPEGAELYTLKADGSFNTDFYAGGAWLDLNTEAPSTTKIAPGQGFLIYSTVNSSLTFVGEVKQGQNTVPLNTGFSLVGSVAPQSYELRAPNFPEINGLVHYSYNNGFVTSIFDSSVGWFDEQTEAPRQIFTEPGKGFFIYNAGASNNWTRTFNVN
jgi:hypothetical protein